jgi:pseudouridine-5'-phosphate glycosidase
VSLAELRGDIVILACAASAGIHAALAPEHYEESFAAGTGFAASAFALAAIAVVLSKRSESVVATTVAAIVFVGLLASYALAVTTGVPGVHPEVEPVEGFALVTKAIELVGLLAAAAALRIPVVHVNRPKGAAT